MNYEYVFFRWNRKIILIYSPKWPITIRIWWVQICYDAILRWKLKMLLQLASVNYKFFTQNIEFITLFYSFSGRRAAQREIFKNGEWKWPIFHRSCSASRLKFQYILNWHYCCLAFCFFSFFFMITFTPFILIVFQCLEILIFNFQCLFDRTLMLDFVYSSFFYCSESLHCIMHFFFIEC